MAFSDHEATTLPPSAEDVPIEQLARQQGVRPVASVDERWRSVASASLRGRLASLLRTHSRIRERSIKITVACYHRRSETSDLDFQKVGRVGIEPTTGGL